MMTMKRIMMMAMVTEKGVVSSFGHSFYIHSFAIHKQPVTIRFDT